MSAPKRKRSRLTAPMDFPEAMVFHPTLDELADFSGLMQTIEAQGAHLGGICKIVPPKEWIPRKQGYDPDTFKHLTIEAPKKQIFTQIGEQRAFQTKCLCKGPMSIKEYHELATSSRYAPPKHTSYEDLERKYWKSLHFMPPIYGADVADSITDPEVTAMNIAHLDTILKHYEEDTGQVFAGVNSPYLYFGMWKATFSWHVEDMDFYGINFLHYGMPKTWYCVPPKYGYLMERAAAALFPNVASWCTNFMRHKTCLISPHIMDEMGVPYQKVIQEERDIIVVFPYAYHSGFNHGYNIAESTNFASERWIEYGKRHRSCDCSRNQVKMDMSVFVKRFQPEKYDDWMAGRDIAPHPEDPPEVVDEIKLRAEDPEAYKKLMHEKWVQKEKPNFDIFVTKQGRQLKYNTETLKLHPKSKFKNFEEEQDFEKFLQGLDRKAKDGVFLDVYQHVEYNNLKVIVFPRTYKCIGEGLDIIREVLGRPNIGSVKELIETGEMIKIKQKLFKRKVKPRVEKREKVLITRKVEKTIVADVYRHVLKDIQAVVKEGTFDILGDISDELSEILAWYSLQELVESDIMKMDHQARVTIEEEIKEEVTDDEGSPTITKKLDLYVHEPSGQTVTVYQKTKKIVGRKGPKIVEIIGSKSVEECINEGMLRFVKTVYKTAGAPKPKIFHLYQHVEHTDLTFLVNSTTQKLVGKNLSMQEALLGKRDVQDLVDSGELIYMGEKVLMANSESEKTTKKSMQYQSFRIVGMEEDLGVATNESRVGFCFDSGLDQVEKLVHNSTMQELMDDEKLTHSNVELDQVQKNLLKKLLAHRMSTKKVTFLKWRFTNDDRKIVLADDDGDVVKEYRDKYAHELGTTKLDDLAADNVLSLMDDNLELYENELDLRKALGNDILAKKDQLDIVYNLTAKCFDVLHHTHNQRYIIKEETFDWKANVKVEEEAEYEEDLEDGVEGTSTDLVPADEEMLDEDDIILEGSDAEALVSESGSEDEDDSDYEGTKVKRTKTKSAGTRRQSISFELGIENQMTNLLKEMRIKLQASNEPQVPFVLTDILAAHKDLTEYTINIFLPGLKELKCITIDDTGRLWWQGLKTENTRQILWNILDEPQTTPDSLFECEIWVLCRSVLKASMLNRFNGYRLSNLTRKVFNLHRRDELRRSRIRSALNLLTGMKLLKRKRFTYYYNGPNAYDGWKRSEFDRYGPHLHFRQCRVDVRTQKLTPEQEEIANQLSGNMHVDRSTSSGTAILLKRRQEMAEVMKKYCAENKLTLEQERSVKFGDVTCKCGTSIKVNSSTRTKAHTGFKKRARCQKCPGCKTPKCMKCANCLNPSFKQACSNRVCYFPLIPYCPCFE
ncbi:hypothetical protein TCAL_03931 [Tigriopus californicus]|uniref:[Histone H3]-trimethyl-L-lysine(9) demethylase n=1 Tax=Tigriopus californicus TaxID=6832 RepID=A0A553P2M8_TIGCA|nr:uncharacterized protein LOC131884156 [Tigriopus californicus]TRY71946.1 hypothetical protein TCAL_03931 [Tigriopus californicus]|eukprot:TCALIF_03931-PA protein Name:"Similar to Kdm4B Probable lysine-specific demethylase 4B (Drosophila melanogaster)" AED:0.36 eAED:0.37 QI:0/-1/0/1/-1/1/1/0/1347